MTAWWRNDELFFSGLEEGHKWELYVATKLLQAGLWVRVPTKSVRNSIDEAAAYADEADVWVTRSEPAKVEVKSRRVRFTGPDDIPSENRPFFVTTENSWNDAETKPVAVIVVFQETGGMAVASGKDSQRWERRPRYDRVRNIRDVFLCAPVDTLYTFEEFVGYMRQREGRTGPGETPA